MAAPICELAYSDDSAPNTHLYERTYCVGARLSDDAKFTCNRNILLHSSKHPVNTALRSSFSSGSTAEACSTSRVFNAFGVDSTATNRTYSSASWWQFTGYNSFSGPNSLDSGSAIFFGPSTYTTLYWYFCNLSTQRSIRALLGCLTHLELFPPPQIVHIPLPRGGGLQVQTVSQGPIVSTVDQRYSLVPVHIQHCTDISVTSAPNAQFGHLVSHIWQILFLMAYGQSLGQTGHLQCNRLIVHMPTQFSGLPFPFESTIFRTLWDLGLRNKSELAHHSASESTPRRAPQDWHLRSLW